MLLGDFARRPAVGFVVAVDLSHTLDGFFEGAKAEQAPACRQVLFEPGGLPQRRPAAGEVMTGAVAEPARVTLDVGCFCDADLRPGLSDEVLITRQVSNPAGLGYNPTVVAEQPYAGIVGFVSP